MAKHAPQCPVIARHDQAESALGYTIQPTVRSVIGEQVRAHHGSRSQRDHHRDHNGDAEGDRKLPKEPPHDTAHHQQRDEYRDQRNADGNNRKAYLSGPAQRGAQGVHPQLKITSDIFHDYDRIVHHEAGGDRQRHEREVVQAVPADIHDAEGADQRHRDDDAGDQSGAQAPQKDEDHQDHERNGRNQGEFDIMHRCPDCHGLILRDRELNRLRDGGADLGERVTDSIASFDNVRARLAADGYDDGRLAALRVAGVPDVLDRIDHVSKVGDANNGAPLVQETISGL